jgi:hypothetical protein
MGTIRSVVPVDDHATVVRHSPPQQLFQTRRRVVANVSLLAPKPSAWPGLHGLHSERYCKVEADGDSS